MYIFSLHSFFGAGIAQSLSRLGYGLGGRGVGVRFPAEARDFCLLHNVQTGSGAHPASYAMDTGDSFLGGKSERREADLKHLYSAEVKNGGAIPSLPHTSSWRGA
jgi:hypothetical protein